MNEDIQVATGQGPDAIAAAATQAAASAVEGGSIGAAGAPAPDIDAEIADLMSRSAVAGRWRAELHSGLLYWSREVFDIYGLDFRPGPVNFVEALLCYHPDDRHGLLELIDHAARHRCGCRATFRVKSKGGEGYVFIRSLARVHVDERGHEQMVGILAVVDETVVQFEPLG